MHMYVRVRRTCMECVLYKRSTRMCQWLVVCSVTYFASPTYRELPFLSPPPGVPLHPCIFSPRRGENACRPIYLWASSHGNTVKRQDVRVQLLPIDLHELLGRQHHPR